jgi:hypothetical protein
MPLALAEYKRRQLKPLARRAKPGTGKPLSGRR